jgi:gliding motility-associated-like protein
LKSEIVKVSAVPNITVPPQSQSVCAGGNVTFFVTVTGTGSGNLVFLWKKNGVTITNAVGRISGANTASLTLSNITISDADNYTCVITDDIDSTNTITSDPATLIVNPIPSLVITNPPAVCSPATVNLTSSTITAGSDLGLRYEYYTDMIGTVLLTPNAVSTSGTYYIKAINEVTGCYDIKPVLVVINALPIVVTTAPLAVCAPATVDLTLTSVTASSTSGLTYTYWRDSSASNTLTNPSAVSASGTYFIKGTNVNGCSSTTSVSVTVRTLPVLNISNPAGVCSPSTIDLTAASVTAGSSSSLTLGYYVDSAAALELGNPSFVNSAGTYYIKATNANGCSIVKPVQARIDLPPIIAVNSPIRICANTTSYTLNSSDIRVVDYDTLAWTYDGFGQLTISDPLRPTYTPNTADISRGKVTLTLTARFCNLESTRSIDIEFIAMPTVDIGPDVTICENSVSYVIPDTGGTTGYSTLAWTSTGSAGTLNDMTILTPTYTPSPSDISDGEVVFTLKVNSGVPCNTILTDTKKITIQRLPVITTVSSAQICETENVYDISATTITNSYDVNSVGWTSSGTGRFISSTRGVNNPSYLPSALDKANGFVNLTISVTPLGQCSDIVTKSFRLNFIKSPIISAGPDLTKCGERFQISGATAQAGTYSSLLWTSSGTGTFEDDTVPNPFYIPSNSDIQNGLPITLTLTATPISPCVATTASVSSLRLNLVKSPLITVVNQADICEYNTNVTVLGTIIENQSSFVWSSTTGTIISDIRARQPRVTPSLVDINQGFMDLTITAQNDVCSLPVSRIVRININRRPVLRVGTTITVCIHDGSISPIVSTFDSTVLDATVTGLPNGLYGDYNVISKTFTISGTPTSLGSYPYTISSLSACGELESGIITVTDKTISYKTINYVQATCQNSSIDPIVFNVYKGITNVTITPPLPSGILYTLNTTTGILTISGTPTVAVPSLQTYTITPTGTFCGPVGDNMFRISVSPEATITFLPNSGSLSQSVCQNAPIVPITFRIGGSATGVNASLLPPGITLSYATSTGIYTIEGNPTLSGVITIPIATTGCIKTINASITKVDTVVSINLISDVGTDNQLICQNNFNSPIIPIRYSLTGATGVSVTGLPDGVTSTFDSTTGIVSIIGVPIVSGIFNYRIETSPCPIIKNGVLKVSTPISLTNVKITNVTCSNSNDGKVELTIVGGDSSNYSIQWIGPNGFRQNRPSIFGLYSGDYTISGTDAIGCPIPSNTYTVLPVLPISIELESSTNVNCTGSLGCANFSISGGSGTYNSFLLQFLDPISQTLQTVVPLDNNYFNICSLNAGLYYLTARDTFNCSSSPYPFTIYDFGNLNIDSVDLDTSLCSGTSGKVRVTVSSLDPNLTFYYNNEIVPNTIVGDNVYELAISNPTFPNGIIKVINQQNCWDSETVSTILPSPTQLNFSSVNLTAYGVISVNESVKFTNGLIPSNIPAEYDYLVWDFGDNTPYNVFYNPKDVNPNTNGESLTTVFHSFAKDGLYPVTLTVFNKFGCSKSITEIITVGQGASIMAPTAFSPNNDGINDLFRPSLLGLKEVNVNIYDNWGNLIYEITSDTASLPTDWGWNGLENGKSEPVNGTYRYYIMAKTINDLIIEKEGQFILIK